MEEFLMLIVQFLLEFLLDIFVNYPFSDIDEFYDYNNSHSLRWRCFIFLCAGCVLGGVSILLIHQSFLHHSGFRIANLIVAPLASAAITQKLAIINNAGGDIVRQRYWQAFWFTLGFALVRFAYATRF